MLILKIIITFFDVLILNGAQIRVIYYHQLKLA
nr:MAG TPA: hypothetical protein [Caudoviricetes sp.]DAO30341.1 MAG TPA: hypothetical protein [Caudoviricetes sp.]DAW76203.1 MAG TPA: hypothetical protein [Caudoviricetes sp.]